MNQLGKGEEEFKVRSKIKRLKNYESKLLSQLAGSIIMSDEPGVAMRRLRQYFNIPQKLLSEKIEVSQSVISDYEGGRRENPGSQFIRRFITALFEIDMERGGSLISELAVRMIDAEPAVIDIKRFPSNISLKRFVRSVSGEILTGEDRRRKVNGYIVIDNDAMIKNYSGIEYIKLFNDLDGKAVLFMNVRVEASPIITLRFTPTKPDVMVYHGSSPTGLDVQLAEDDGITLIHSRIRSPDDLLKSLRRLHNSIACKTGYGRVK